MWTTLISFLGPLLLKGKNLLGKNKLATIAVIAILLLLLGLYYEYTQNEKNIKQLAIAGANIKALNDSIHVVSTKDGHVEFDKAAFLALKVKDLEKVNDSLAKKIEKIKGTVISAVSSSSVIADNNKPLKVIVTHDTVDNTITHAEFSFDTTYSKGNFHHLKVKTSWDTLNHVSGILAQDEIGFSATTGIKKDSKGNYVIFVQPDYPNTTITELNGAVIDKRIFEKPDRRRIFTLGLGIGFVPLTYDFHTRNVELNFNRIGVSGGVNINFSELFRRK